MYVKRVELSNFKSFGGTTPVPLLPGFTVISGPNGSGKSNILDALLFALGLSSSKGMRADRLPDLVNHTQTSRGRATVEASVTVTFDLAGEAFVAADPDLPTPATEWTVTRKLRVTQQGTYTSNYYINGESCNLSELHEQLHQLRIYPEGYNVVLQGDVTSIISMNPRERREIIDEMAGVAAFDRKINQAKEKLDAVKEREDRARIVEAELIAQRDRLSQDRIKAEKYQKLRAELEAKSHWEAVISYRQGVISAQRSAVEIETGDRTLTDLATQLAALIAQTQDAAGALEELNRRVKALGEEEQLALQSTLATREAELRQIQRQQQELAKSSQETVTSLRRTQQEIHEQLQAQESLAQQQTAETRSLATSTAARDEIQIALEASREAASSIAASSEAWVQQQTQLHRQIDTLLKTLDPQRTEQASLQERIHQQERQTQEQTQTAQRLEREMVTKELDRTLIEEQSSAWQRQVQSLAESLSHAEQSLSVQQDTQTRLLQEQRDKQRKLDKLEAQTQALQESQGTHTTRMILQSGLTGVCGLVAQLGQVEPRYQLALETAAGARLGNLVVEDDSIAAAAIELLKQKKAGRATFLPLNKLSVANTSKSAPRADGLINYAVNLVEYEPRYRDVFAYVFGNTVVFETLPTARRYLGQYRIVTLDGELLESSGAMTGGSTDSRYSLHFGTVEATESAEMRALRDRLREIDQVLHRCLQESDRLTATVKQRGQELTETRQLQRESQLQLNQLQTDLKSLAAQQVQLQEQQSKQTQELAKAQTRLQILEVEIPRHDTQLQQWRLELAELEESQTHSEWQQIQSTVRAQETQLNERELALRSTEQRLKDLDTQSLRLQEKTQQAQQRVQDYRTLQTTQLNQDADLKQQETEITQHLAQLRAELAVLEKTLGSAKQERDRLERQMRDRHTAQQQLEWQQQKLQETQQTRRQELAALQSQLETQRVDLPDPLPEIPENLGLEQLQQELRTLQKRIQAMEPVNMLALEEYDRTQTRLQELSQKLAILDEERTELLMRIENFTTLRQRAFKEAFDAVNQNFQVIFAELSDGDGYLHLDNPADPFGSGLNLVAHPKGKPVQRLASMSGGEKSLTALSFIFALQRYRPSPFYAFDEVDMFLDGANVERLARMIRKQAQQAQFIVVSLRRPMIESAERTIGVTQARGAYTQVLGIKLQSASV